MIVESRSNIQSVWI